MTNTSPEKVGAHMITEHQYRYVVDDLRARVVTGRLDHLRRRITDDNLAKDLKTIFDEVERAWTSALAHHQLVLVRTWDDVQRYTRYREYHCCACPRTHTTAVTMEAEAKGPGAKQLMFNQATARHHAEVRYPPTPEIADTVGKLRLLVIER